MIVTLFKASTNKVISAIVKIVTRIGSKIISAILKFIQVMDGINNLFLKKFKRIELFEKL